jgi:hypothetical protein
LCSPFQYLAVASRSGPVLFQSTPRHLIFLPSPTTLH